MKSKKRRLSPLFALLLTENTRKALKPGSVTQDYLTSCAYRIYSGHFFLSVMDIGTELWRAGLRVSRSLTIKQMVTVSGIAVVILCLFIVIQLFHFVQQRKTDYVWQMENLVQTVHQPLSTAISKANLPQAEHILDSLRMTGIPAHAQVVLPNGLQLLRADFEPEKPIPSWITTVFKLPVQVAVPLYLPESGSQKPLATLTVQADSWRIYQFILNTLAMMVVSFFLLALMMSVAISWCINRLIVRPVRQIAQELQELTPRTVSGHQLPVQPSHRDDEIGLLIRHYNDNQQTLSGWHGCTHCQSTHCALTGVSNKARFLEKLAQQLSNVAKNGRLFTVVVLRVETLLEANGLVQDSARDALAQTIIVKIRQYLGMPVELAQLSVCDFALLIEQLDTPDEALHLAQKLMLQLKQPVNLQHMLLRPQLSIGLTQCLSGNPNAAEVLGRGIAAMMAARHQGKNQILVFDAALAAKTEKRLTREYDILQSIESGSLALWLQPQVDMRTGSVTGAEALLRMRQADGSWRLPLDLIADAEALGAINALGRWVLEESCRVLAEWQQRGLSLTLSVNLSPIQLGDGEVVTHLKALLLRYNIPAGRLVLEMTETAQIGEPGQTISLLKELHAAGVSVALDDFGMGYANLNWLAQFRALPAKSLKIDRSFVATLPNDDTMVRIVASVASLSGLDIVAEGIENEAQRDWLLEHNIAIGQGYFYSPPLPQNEFAAYYAACPASRH